MSYNVAINGFGRIGRLFLRNCLLDKNKKEIKVKAINDLAKTKTISHLFKYDSMYGTYPGKVKALENDEKEYDSLLIDDDYKEIKIFNEEKPENLPWDNLNIDLVLEATGKFRDREGAKAHLKAGAKRVLISAPAKDEDVTIVMGVNEEEFDPFSDFIISNSSCTTNAISPLLKVINEEFGVVSSYMTTIHSYTNDQRLLDLTHEDLRRARAAAESIIPTTTGAAKAVSKVLPLLKGKVEGFAIRVPTPTVSMIDLTCFVRKETDREEVNRILEERAEGFEGILDINYTPLVSSDYKGSEASCIVDGLLTDVSGENLIKVCGWYDNEWAYSKRLLDLTSYINKKTGKLMSTWK
ncbi:type I glyceraldehyde-3-phosphate dehydrogenase [Natranaerofaba carboxydovora]|uniref:type I glyceraldehyde-3-phosphate dehydrogenase n=1 Tax=Natranaerofaba carboxydovora TaxID=2742683 RepID=UPI001F132CEB|nr:type I glyceraldehyde-3-phosphate dehydrogenase [Natranaerofaba carboxydovora]UMZ75064.1 Glyceraldehyde-3-phosphate dehydrogenase [Natranaerofaba carboxydovora]